MFSPPDLSRHPMSHARDLHAICSFFHAATKPQGALRATCCCRLLLSTMRLSFGFVLALATSTHAFVARAPLLNTPSRQVQPGASWSRLMAMKDVGVGIIGAGRIGIVHLEALASW